MSGEWMERNSLANVAEPGGESLTIQAHEEEANLSKMMERFGQGYVIPPGIRAPLYGDFSGQMDFRKAQQAILDAKESFGLLGADVRARFHNDPQEFLEFVESRDQDGKRTNLTEMRKWGLALPEEPPEAPKPPDPVVEELKGLRADLKPK